MRPRNKRKVSLALRTIPRVKLKLRKLPKGLPRKCNAAQFSNVNQSVISGEFHEKDTARLDGPAGSQFIAPALKLYEHVVKTKKRSARDVYTD